LTIHDKFNSSVLSVEKTDTFEAFSKSNIPERNTLRKSMEGEVGMKIKEVS
jgi:hypothetical protein